MYKPERSPLPKKLLPPKLGKNRRTHSPHTPHNPIIRQSAQVCSTRPIQNGQHRDRNGSINKNSPEFKSNSYQSTNQCQNEWFLAPGRSIERIKKCHGIHLTSIKPPLDISKNISSKKMNRNGPLPVPSVNELLHQNQSLMAELDQYKRYGYQLEQQIFVLSQQLMESELGIKRQELLVGEIMREKIMGEIMGGELEKVGIRGQKSRKLGLESNVVGEEYLKVDTSQDYSGQKMNKKVDVVQKQQVLEQKYKQISQLLKIDLSQSNAHNVLINKLQKVSQKAYRLDNQTFQLSQHLQETNYQFQCLRKTTSFLYSQLSEANSLIQQYTNQIVLLRLSHLNQKQSSSLLNN